MNMTFLRDETDAHIGNMKGFRIGGPQTMDGRMDYMKIIRQQEAIQELEYDSYEYENQPRWKVGH